MLKNLGRHLWRVKTLVMIFVLFWWVTKRGFPALGMLPPASGEEPERWYILFAVLYKMSGARVLFHVVRHELFPYMRLAQAAAIQTLACCLLIGFLLLTSSHSSRPNRATTTITVCASPARRAPSNPSPWVVEALSELQGQRAW